MASEAAGALRPPGRSGLNRLSRRIRLLSGWRRALAALTAGALAGLAMPPLFVLPGLIAGISLLVLLLDAPGRFRIRAAAVAGWCFGYGYFLVGVYWIGVSLTVDAAAHGWLIPLFILFFPGALALFFAAGAAVARALWTHGAERALTLAAALALTEWLRGHVLTGFPWNLPGLAFAVSEAALQPLALVGIYGLSLAVLALAALPAMLIDRRGRLAPRGWRFALPVAALGLAGVLYGVVRLSGAATEEVPGVLLRIVQPNVAQHEKYLPRLRWQHWEDLLKLTTEPGAERVTHVIWPEAAPPFVLDRDEAALAMIGTALPAGASLITGAVRVATSVDGTVTPYNALHVIDTGGRVRETYDKAHLVPFGEYLPLRFLLEPLGLTKIVQVPGSFGAGSGPRTLAVEGAPPFSPLICYEIIFPGAVTAPDRRPDWLLNVTDDSWFGDTSGPRQHLAIARARAIEEGLPVVRAANTGISAVIDPFGRVRVALPYGVRGTLDHGLPAALAPPPFTRLGDLPFFVALAALLLPPFAFRLRRRFG